MHMSKSVKKNTEPRLRFLKFQDNGEWPYERGDFLFDQITNKDHNSDLPILAITQEHGAIPRDQIDYNVAVTDKSLESYKVVEVGDFIISLRSFQGGIEYSNYRGICSPAYVILRRKTESISDFYRHYFKTQRFIRDLTKNLEGLRDGKMVSYTQFSELMLPSPLPEEQQKIADCLSSLDELISAENQKLEALRQHKRGLMQQLFPAEGEKVPKLRFKEFEENGHWEEKSLGPMTEKVGSGVTPLGGESNYKKSGRPFVRSQNVGWGTFLLDDIAFINDETHQNSISTEIEMEDVLLNITGASIGRSAVATREIKGGNVNQHVCIIRTNKSLLNPFFLSQYLISVDGQIQIDSFQAGGNRQGLNFAQIRSFSIPIPPKREEQMKIAESLSSVDLLIAGQTEKTESLKAHKKGLTQQLFPNVNAIS
jgi:type I restriction enzyme, S subunit